MKMYGELRKEKETEKEVVRYDWEWFEENYWGVRVDDVVTVVEI